MARYKYNNAHEWFHEYTQRLESSALHSIANDLADKLDGDTIQDMFQNEMDADGYFRDLDKKMPALFEIDEYGEANGTVYWFCSDECREKFVPDNDPIMLKPGDDNNYDDQSSCAECGGTLN